MAVDWAPPNCILKVSLVCSLLVVEAMHFMAKGEIYGQPEVPKSGATLG